MTFRGLGRRKFGARTAAPAKGYALLIVGALLLAGCATTVQSPVSPQDGLVRWTAVDSLNHLLPPDVRVYAGVNDTMPLRAWFVRIPARYEFRVEVSDDTTDVRETTSSFAKDAGACVAVNGGYFRMGDFPASAAGLLVQDRQITADATEAVGPDSARQFVTRAAIGRMPDGHYEIRWVGQFDEMLVPSIRPITPGNTVMAMERKYQRGWRPAEAMSAGPMLLRDGHVRVTAFEEGFMRSSIPNVHPRTAAGIAANGDLILMVVDGRQEASRGVNLEELARLMRSAGAVDALNLDGGGSSTLVVRDRLVNRPVGRTLQRQVMNALVAFCE